MNIEIYYFSGTGNSYYVASTISQSLNAEMKPIIPYLKKEKITTNAEMIGLVFPIYDFAAPDIVYQFIKKLKTPNSTYYFAVCTYGVKPLKTMKKLEKIMSLYNKKLSGGFTIRMPHNGLGYSSISSKKQKKMFNEFEKKTELIIDHIKTKKQGYIEKSTVLDYFVLLSIFIRLIPAIFPLLKQALLHGWDSLGFYANDQCNGCRTCLKICPVNNIQINEDKPQWGDNCLNCFACIHWCPQQSIQIANLTKKMQRYHHPKIHLQDIINQKLENH